MRELTETQHTILIEAICRTSGSIYPMPQHLKGGAAKKVLTSLETKGLIDKDGIITQPGLDQIDPDWTSIYATEMCAAAKKEADEAIRELAMAMNGENNDTMALANDDDEDTFDYAANDAAMAAFTADREAREAEESAAADAAQAAWVANGNIKDAIAAAAFETDPANADQIAWDAEDAARIAAGGLPDGDTTALANDETTALANDETTDDTGQGGWTDEPDPEILAIAKKHFSSFTQAEWPAIRNTIEEAYAWGYNDAKAQPKRQTTVAKASRKDSKQALVVEMLKRPEGATSAQIAEATGWQSHTIRGFLSIAKRKLGLVIAAQRTRVVGPNQQGSPGSYSTYFAK